MPEANKQIQAISFLVILGIMSLVMFYMFRPLANVLFFSVILALVLRPLYNKIAIRLKSPAWSAFVTVLLVLLGVSLFLSIFGSVLWGELSGLYSKFHSGELVLNRDDILSSFPTYLQGPLRSVMADITNLLSNATAGAFQTISSVISNLAGFFFDVFLVFFSTYYLLKDGTEIKKLIMAVSPISEHQENLLYEKIVRSVRGVMKGTFLVALIQSVVGAVGFAFFGLPNPILWAGLTFLAAFIPNLGTSLIIVPAVLYLYFTGHSVAAVGMAIWGGVAVGAIDNVVSPRLVGRSAQLHPLLVLLSVIGGLKVFGFLGFLLGPIFVAVFSALIQTYLTNYKHYVE